MTVDITTIGIEYDTSGLIAGTNAQNQTTASANRMGDALVSNEQQTKANNTASKAYATTLGALAAAFGVSQITRQIDEYTKYTAQLKLASNSNNEYLQSLDAVRKIATDSQASLAGTGTLYARIANGTRDLGVAQSQVAKITESVNLSLKVSGATASEAASAQLQLSQAFASGTLRGEEFNAVNEAAPRLMKALADGIGVPVGALKDMASNGLITSEIMARVLPQALDQLREEAKNVQTLSGAFQVLKNNMMEFIGIQAQSNGIVSVLTSGIGLLASNLDMLAGALITVAAVKFGNFLTSITTSVYSTVTANRALALSNLETAKTNAVATASTLALADARVIELRQAVLAASGEAALAVTINGLIPAQARATAASIAHTEALAAQTVAAGAASTGMGVLRGAMAFLGGPIGLIIAALGIAATAWSVFGDSAETANEKTKVSSLETTNEVIARLDVEISKLKERNKLRDSGVSISGASEANQVALAKAKQDYQDAISGTGGFSAPNEIAKAELIKATGAAYGTLLNKVKEVSDETEKLNGKTQSNKLAEWLGKNGTQAQKMAAAFAEAKKEVGVLTPEMESLIRLKFADKTATKSLTIEEDALHTARKQGTKLDLEMAKEFDKSMDQFAKDQLKRTHEVTKSITDNILEQGKNYLSLKNKIEQYTDSLNESNDLSKLEMSLIGSSNSERQIALEQYQIALTLKKQLAEIDKKNLSQGEKNMLASDAQEAANLGRMNISGKDRSVDIDVTKAKELLNIMSEIDNVTQKAAQGMADSFGRVGSAIGDLTTALSGYGRAQAAIAAKLADDNKKAGNDPKKLAAAQIDASQETARAQISSYANMAKAAKGFFKENSAGYRAMEGAEKAYRAVEMAMAIQTMLTKSGLLTAFTGLFVASKATETAATVASVAPDVAASMAKGTAAAAVGVASQAQGDPYTAWPRMAAMAAAMAALGFAVSGGGGGGGGQTAAQRQKEQGTGSVFGDASAKSDSIAKSIEDMSKTSNRLLPVNQNMLAALKNIESSMTGFTNLLARDQGVVDGSNLGIKTGMLSGGTAVTNLVASIGEKVFGSSILGTLSRTISNLFSNTKQTVVDSGVSFGGSLKALEAGKGFNQYASVDTTKSSFFGLKKSTSNSQVNQSLSQELSSQMGLIFGGMSDALKEANKLLGGNAAEIEATFASLVLSTEKISLKGLSGDALTQALNGVISKSLDEMAEAVFPAYDKFRQVGEGYAQTVLRVANTFASANQIFEEINLKLFEVGDAGVSASMAFTKLIGGLDGLQSASQSYLENFFTEEERTAKTLKALTSEFEKQNLVLPTTRNGYRAMVEELSRTGTPEQLASVLKLNEAFASVVKNVEKIAAPIEQQFLMQRKLEVASIEASQALEAQERATKALARETELKTYNETADALLRAGKVAELMAANYSLNQIDFGAYVSNGSFNAAGFNSEIIRQRAKTSIDLANKASADAINVEDITGVLSNLFSFTKGSEFTNELRRDLNLNSGFQNDIGYVMFDFIEASLNGARLKDFAARGKGVAGILSASEDIGYQSELQSAYARSLNQANELLRLNIITQDEYTVSLNQANEMMKDQIVDIEKLNEAYRQAGIDSVAFYFNKIGDAVAKLNEEAAKASEPIALITSAISRFTSISDVFGLSSKAAGTVGSNAELVSQSAAIAAQILTTQSAQSAAKVLAEKSSFAGSSSTQLRDFSLLVEGVKKFDPQSLENGFLRISDALNKGIITQGQYTDLFNTSVGIFNGSDEEIANFNSSMKNLSSSMGSFADSILVDSTKTTLSLSATRNELMRQYDVAKILASTGDTQGISQFQNVANQLLDVGKYATRAEYNVAFGKIYGDARNLETLGSRNVNNGENVVAQLKASDEKADARIAKLEESLLFALSAIMKNTDETVTEVRGLSI